MNARTYAADRDRAYGRDVRVALCLTLGGMVVSFLFLKQPAVRPYQLRRPVEPISIALPVDLVQLPSPTERPARVAVPIPVQDGEQADVTIGRTTGDNIFSPPPDFALDSVPFYRVERKPVALKLAQPDYPPLARAAGIEGRTAVSLLIDTLGQVAQTELYAGSGSSLLDVAALAAAQGCLFRPAYQRDRPVPVWVTMTFSFRLQ
ncbi:TonB family protein [candidate division WOR-3 bacterium]|nr:TonB family protein [candidate division WOR-3 bacterium]